MGSFANVCILRLPHDQSIAFPGSHCPKCGHALRIGDNIPLISFLALKGRCRSCRTPISWQYPLVEFSMAALFVFHAWWFSGRPSHTVLADILGFYLLTLSIIDYRHRIIPDELSLSLLGIGILLSFINPYIPSASAWVKVLQSVAAAVGGGLVMLLLAWGGEKAFKKEALGGGDIKLIAACGAVLGWQGILGPLMIGSLSGALVACILLLLKKKKLGETLPFGPFLSLGAYLTCLFPGFCAFLLSQR
jgi:leader peptidase (prepilin peptidase)/N-methyltransferase